VKATKAQQQRSRKEIAMPTVQVLDAKGKAAGSLELKADVFGSEIRGPLSNQAVTRELADRRGRDARHQGPQRGIGRRSETRSRREPAAPVRARRGPSSGRAAASRRPTPRSYAKDMRAR